MGHPTESRAAKTTNCQMRVTKFQAFSKSKHEGYIQSKTSFLRTIRSFSSLQPDHKLRQVRKDRLATNSMSSDHLMSGRVRARSHRTRKHICMRANPLLLLPSFVNTPIVPQCVHNLCACCELLRILCELGLRPGGPTQGGHQCPLGKVLDRMGVYAFPKPTVCLGAWDLNPPPQLRKKTPDVIPGSWAFSQPAKLHAF